MLNRAPREFEATCDCSLFDALAHERLVWLPDIGVGFYPVAAGYAPYDDAYFERYCRQADSDIGRALMAFRCDLVAKHYRGPLLDVGIGSGAFIVAREAAGHGGTWGFDVNPRGVEWLTKRGLFYNWQEWPNGIPAISFWDVLEHIADFRPILSRVTGYAFISVPLFDGPEHIARSKHFRVDEHYWYFSRRGIVRVMNDLGFECVDVSFEETRIGREDIGTFVFRRV